MESELASFMLAFCGGGGVFSVSLAAYIKYRDSRASASESKQSKYYGDLGARLVKLEEDVRDQLAQILELSREVSRLEADNRIKGETIRRLRAQRNNLLRLAKRLGAQFDEVGLTEISGELIQEIEVADEATSAVEAT